MDFDRYPWAVPIVSILGAGVILMVDYVVGRYVEFPVFFLLPVMFSAWYGGRSWGLTFAVTLPLIRFYFSTVWDSPGTLIESMVNAVIRISVFSLIAVLADRVASQTRQLEREVQQLEGLLPICSHCKKIKDQDGSWTIMERYISDHSHAEFSHGICPDCLEKHYPEISLRMKERGAAGAAT
jgi:K+-sensing histidine kinase KdpD